MSPDKSGKLHILDGNTICALLTHFKLAKLAETNSMPPRPIVVTTLVTTSMVTRIARHFGAQVVNNLLVGFKYIAEVLWQLEKNGSYEDVQGSPADYVIGSEESHGVLVMPQIRDKDAAGGCLLLAELALDQKRHGRTVLDYLDGMRRQFGYFRNEIRNLIMPGIEGKQNMARMLDRLRKQPPTKVGDWDVTETDDLWNESGWMGPFKGATDRQSRNFLLFRFGDTARIALRPSGTEPKAKAYIEASCPPCPANLSAADWAARCREVDERCMKLADAFLAICGVT
jgi:phosphoglucomutase/phosphomannomutase